MGLTASLAALTFGLMLSDDISCVQIDTPDEGLLKATTHCCCCMQSFFVEMPACLGANGEGSCIWCGNAGSFGCCQCTDEHKACGQELALFQCCDYRKPGESVIYNVGATMISLFCMKGASKAGCKCDDSVKYAIISKWQSLCCDYRCALPPSDEAGVAFGVSCCGIKLAGAPGGSCKA